MESAAIPAPEMPTATVAWSAEDKGLADVLVMANLALALFAIVARIKVDVADERGARMIAVGSFDDAPPKGIILGSTTNKLLHLTKQPVLVVPAEEK
jgi:nucleotide-binding universal stress UspA family protein